MNIMKAIVAVSQNWGIGHNNDLLYNIPEDKKFFRRTTLGKVVIMGRKTLMSMPGSKPLKDRINIVFTRDEDFNAEGVTVCNDIHDLPALIKDHSDDDVFVIGGEEIYNALLPFCDTIYVTKIKDVKPADKFFPDLDNLCEWKMTDCSEEADYDGIKYQFCTYTNIAPM